MPEFTNIPSDDSPRLEVDGDDQLILIKKGQRHVFHCPAGQEAQLLAHLQQLVADPHHDLNWFDAAVLSHHLGQRMSDRLTGFYPPRKTG